MRTAFPQWHDISWPSVALGLAVVMIEAGYLIAYRIGWKLNRAALTSNVIVAILLIPIAATLFRGAGVASDSDRSGAVHQRANYSPSMISKRINM